MSVTQGGVDPGRQLVSVVRKGSRQAQELPASLDAFVWLRLYQVEVERLVPKGRREPLWWTLRRPFRPLNYQAAHRMFERANRLAGTAATLHVLRHTAAYRMAEDSGLPLTDVQWVLGHAQLSTTQVYLTPRQENVVRRVLAHPADQVCQAADRRPRLPPLVTAKRPWTCCSPGPRADGRLGPELGAHNGQGAGQPAADPVGPGQSSLLAEFPPRPVAAS